MGPRTPLLLTTGSDAPAGWLLHRAVRERAPLLAGCETSRRRSTRSSNAIPKTPAQVLLPTCSHTHTMARLKSSPTHASHAGTHTSRAAIQLQLRAKCCAAASAATQVRTPSLPGLPATHERLSKASNKGDATHKHALHNTHTHTRMHACRVGCGPNMTRTSHHMCGAQYNPPAPKQVQQRRCDGKFKHTKPPTPPLSCCGARPR